VVHLNNTLANQRFDLKWVVDADEKAAKNGASKSPFAKATTNLDEALADPSVKAVIICTPTAEHKTAILKSARAGKHIMCEKPISLQIPEIDECYNECKKHNVTLLCGTT
jgi:myo-inositol 2-dehydrogenase/D-chiro-inositol 1-dehydrogenase